MENLINTVASELKKAKYAIALTGAGISTESGIPDFRGPGGIWTRDPAAERKAYQTYSQFLENPESYWRDRLMSPSLLGDLPELSPNPGHYALAEMEMSGVLKCVITQNIDNLHRKAGNRHVIEYHGNYSKFRCTSCFARYDADEYNLDLLLAENKLPPLCKKCQGILKIDVVHFTEPIPEDVVRQSLEEVEKCDFMLICGTSAVVYPFAQLPRIARFNSTRPVVIVEVNSERTPLTEEGISDYLIQGKTGEILPLLRQQLQDLK